MKYLVALPILLYAVLTAPLGAQGGRYQYGDVFVSIRDGKVARFSPSGDLKETLQRNVRGQVTGTCFDSDDNLYVTYLEARSMSRFDAQGRLADADWGGPFTGMPESCVLDAKGHIYVSEVGGQGTVRKFDAAGHLLDSYPFPPGRNGVDWIDLAADQCTMFYSSEDDRVRRYDVCSRKPLPDFAGGLGDRCFALRLRENGELLVTCNAGAHRLSPEGRILRSYRFGRTDLFSMNLDPDGAHFWVAPFSGEVYKVNIETGHGTRAPLFDSADRFRRRDFFGSLGGKAMVTGLSIYGERTAAVAEGIRQAEQVRRQAEEEVRRKAEEEARRKAEEEEARRKAEEEARRKAEDEAQRKAEEEARRKAEEEARRQAEAERQRRLGKVTFGPPMPLSFGELAAGDVASDVLDLEGTRLEGKATALVTSSFKARGLTLEIETADGWTRLGSWPVQLTIEEEGRRDWPLRLRIGICAPDVPAGASHEILIEAPGLEEPTVRLRAVPSCGARPSTESGRRSPPGKPGSGLEPSIGTTWGRSSSNCATAEREPVEHSSISPATARA